MHDVFRWYVEDNLGPIAIAGELNRPRGEATEGEDVGWDDDRADARPHRLPPGRCVGVRRRPMMCFDPVVELDLFQRAQDRRERRRQLPARTHAALVLPARRHPPLRALWRPDVGKRAVEGHASRTSALPRLHLREPSEAAGLQALEPSPARRPGGARAPLSDPGDARSRRERRRRGIGTSATRRTIDRARARASSARRQPRSLP